jgi:hypothetical protein
MRPRISHYKIVISGHIVEAFQYAKPVGYSLIASRSKAEYRKRRKIEEQEITKSSLSRTRNRLIRLINANARMWKEEDQIIQPQFLTYTFAENVTNIEVANHIFTNYIKRLNYHKQIKTKYTVVPEFQKRGAVHYHAVFFNLPMINSRQEYRTGEFKNLWGQGFIKKKNIDEVPNIGLYMTKYMTKDATDRRLVGKKKYFSSRGLIKPQVITHEHIAGDVMDFLTDFKPIHAYITQPNEDNHFHPENPTFCATYNLNAEQLSSLKSFYNLSV